MGELRQTPMRLTSGVAIAVEKAGGGRSGTLAVREWR